MPGHGCAVFFDFDGTLVDLAPTPSEVVMAPALTGLLGDLVRLLDGAVAVISGRPLAEIDAYLSPLQLCVAGVHGAEWRGADRQVHRIPVAPLDAAIAPIEALRARFPILRIERKPGAIALHYRQAPELEDACLDAMHEALRRVDGMALQRGKRVVELKPSHASKAAAVQRFMEQAPFKSRRPWFFGDDVTDECAFQAVQTVGLAIKVGAGETLADYRLDGPAEVRRWVERAVRHLGTAAAGEVP
jgi:trehalose 6-phosphate phosphatase